MTTIWTILAVIAVISLIANWNKHVVWGSFILGIILSFPVALFIGFEWVVMAKGGIVGAILGQLLNFIPTENNVS